MSDDWRDYAYLTKSNWPEAIPWMGPKREYGPYPWSGPVHDDPHNVDTYIHTHPDAASCGPYCMGDVCPYCGVPLSGKEGVYKITGESGRLDEITENRNPKPCYHPECWDKRQAEIHGQEHTTLGEWSQ